jgi:pimeloyl-ACP methyl ester carboxylesterase
MIFQQPVASAKDPAIKMTTAKPDPNILVPVFTIVLNLLFLVSCGGRDPAQNANALPPAAEVTAGSTDAFPASGYHKMLVSEPVFSGSVRIIEAGKQHSLSIVLVHGLGERAASDWEQVLPVLAKQYHVVAFDLPGFGSSSKNDTLYSPDRYSSFLKWVVGQYVTGPYVLMGHSLGGALALKYASQYPDNLEYLILVDAAGMLNEATLAKQYLDNKEKDRKSGDVSHFTRDLIEFIRLRLDDLSGDGPHSRIKRALDHEYVRHLLLRGDPKAIATVALMVEDFGAAVEKIRMPTLLIWGANDRVAPFRTAKALAGMLDARLEVIGASAHAPMREQPQEFCRIVLSGIKSRHKRTLPMPLKPELEATAKSAIHEEAENLELTGRYKKIELKRCRHARLAGVTAEEIVITDSSVIIDDSSIHGKEVALQVENSDVVATNVRIAADTAIVSSRSHLDLAGARLEGRKAAVTSVDRSILLFSISRSESPYYSGPLHGTCRVTREKPL